MEKVEIFSKGDGKVSIKGKNPFCYKGSVYLGTLKKEKFIGNSEDGSSCLSWLVVGSNMDYWSIATSVIWRVVEIRLPLSSYMESKCFLLPLIFTTLSVEVRGLHDVNVLKRKGQWTLQVCGKQSLWLFNTLYRYHGSSWEKHISDAFLEGFVEKYC
jgi:hypothetical protein